MVTAGVRKITAYALTARSKGSLVSLELPFCPVRIFAVGIKHPLDITVQRLQDSNPRHHRRSAARNQHEDLDRRLPFRQVGLVLRQAGDVGGGVSQRDELSPAWQRYLILELALPVSHQAIRVAFWQLAI